MRGVKNSFDGENLDTSDIDMAVEILNSTQINILSSAPSLAENKKVVNQVVVFILRSLKRKKQK